jgi:hypothetical protein
MRLNIIRRCARAGFSLTLVTLAAATGTLAQGVQAPEIVPRSAWGAKPADTGLMKPQLPREIVIHHTAERQQSELTLAQKLQRLQRFSRAPGTVTAPGSPDGRPKAAWGDVPYHFYIDSGGRIGEGRDVRYAGDTNTEYDPANRIQIVLEGQFDKEQPTPAQLQSLDRLAIWLAAKYRVAPGKISGHGDHVVTDCPGQGLKAYLPVLRAKVAKAVPAK